MSAEWVEAEEGVPVWRHAVWYDGICLGLAIGGFTFAVLMAVFG